MITRGLYPDVEIPEVSLTEFVPISLGPQAQLHS
jgi:hypothetical protein